MASIQKTKNGKFQVRIKNKVLPKPLFFTFDTMEEASAYADNATRMLKQGVVSQVLMDLSVQKKEAGVMPTGADSHSLYQLRFGQWSVKNAVKGTSHSVSIAPSQGLQWLACKVSYCAFQRCQNAGAQDVGFFAAGL